MIGVEPVRVTNPLLDVLDVLLEAFGDSRRELPDWTIMKVAARSGPTICRCSARRRWWSNHGGPERHRRTEAANNHPS